MKKQILISTFLGALLVTGAAQAASWQESLSSAANELTKESSSSQGGLSASSLTSLLGNNRGENNIACTNKQCKGHKPQGNNISCTKLVHKEGYRIKVRILE